MTSPVEQAPTMSAEDVRVSAGEEGTEASATHNIAVRADEAPVLTDDEYAANFQTALLIADLGRLRSVQTDGGLLGPSDIGGCPQKALYTIRRTPPTDVPKKGKAMVGTALHAVWLPQMQEMNPDLVVEAERTVTMPSGMQLLTHPDLIDPVENSVTDLKSVGDINYRRNQGPEDRHWMQVAVYFLAALQNGDLHSDQGILRLLYVSMTDADEVQVYQRPFSMHLIELADEWLAEVKYAHDFDEDARKDSPPYFCASYCPWVSQCRPPLQDADGQLVNETLRERVRTAKQARDEKKRWERIEKEALAEIKGVSGRAGDVQMISTTVNGQHGPYTKVDFK